MCWGKTGKRGLDGVGNWIMEDYPDGSLILSREKRSSQRYGLIENESFIRWFN